MLTLAIYFCVKLGLLQLYPAYICYKALKVNNQQEFGSLLTFWVVSISYLAVEYFSDIFLFWIPFYTEIKLIIVLWLILPQTQGASVFYTNYLDPFLHQHEQPIDNALLEIQAKLKETILLYGKQLIESIKKLVADTIGLKGHSSSSQPPQAQAAHQASSITPSPENNNQSGIMNPYNLFSTLILSTAQRFQQQGETVTSPTPIQSVIVTPPPPLTVSTTGDAATHSGEKLNRTDSHDSLNSFVDVNKTSNTVTPELTQQQQQGWGGYLSSFVWKSPSSFSLTPTLASLNTGDKAATTADKEIKQD